MMGVKKQDLVTISSEELLSWLCNTDEDMFDDIDSNYKTVKKPNHLP